MGWWKEKWGKVWREGRDKSNSGSCGSSGRMEDSVQGRHGQRLLAGGGQGRGPGEQVSKGLRTDVKGEGDGIEESCFPRGEAASFPSLCISAP